MGNASATAVALSPTRWITLALLAVFSTAMAQQRERRGESAAVAVRYAEGTVHGFLELRTATGPGWPP